jgi:hypothetical protein
MGGIFNRIGKFINGVLAVVVTNPTIEQATGATHNDLSVAVAGKDTAGKVQPLKTDTLGRLILSTLVPTDFDYISLSYTGDDLTGVVYKRGGSGGTTVATLTLVYSSSILQTVTRS